MLLLTWTNSPRRSCGVFTLISIRRSAVKHPREMRAPSLKIEEVLKARVIFAMAILKIAIETPGHHDCLPGD